MLPFGEPRDRPVRWMRVSLCTYVVLRFTRISHSSMMARQMRRVGPRLLRVCVGASSEAR
jgi:hypothetical protein